MKTSNDLKINFKLDSKCAHCGRALKVGKKASAIQLPDGTFVNANSDSLFEDGAKMVTVGFTCQMKFNWV